MKRKKLFAIFIVLIALLVIGAALVIIKNETNNAGSATSTTYEDASGWIWVCSQPIPVKDQGVKYMNGAPSLTPVNQADADKYCHKTGIE